MKYVSAQQAEQKKSSDMLVKNISGEHVFVDLTDVNKEFGNIPMTDGDVCSYSGAFIWWKSAAGGSG